MQILLLLLLFYTLRLRLLADRFDWLITDRPLTHPSTNKLIYFLSLKWLLYLVLHQRLISLYLSILLSPHHLRSLISARNLLSFQWWELSPTNFRLHLSTLIALFILHKTLTELIDIFGWDLAWSQYMTGWLIRSLCRYAIFAIQNTNLSHIYLSSIQIIFHRTMLSIQSIHLLSPWGLVLFLLEWLSMLFQ